MPFLIAQQFAFKLCQHRQQKINVHLQLDSAEDLIYNQKLRKLPHLFADEAALSFAVIGVVATLASFAGAWLIYDVTILQAKHFNATFDIL